MLWQSGQEKAKPSESFSRVISIGPYFTCTDIAGVSGLGFSDVYGILS